MPCCASAAPLILGCNADGNPDRIVETLDIVLDTLDVCTINADSYVNLPTAGEANTASNLGAGKNIFAGKVGVDLEFKGMSGVNIDFVTDGDTVTFSAATEVGEANTVSIRGAGDTIFGAKVGVDLEFKGVCGVNVDFVSDGDTLTFSAIGDHGELAGLADDDHTQYILVDGSRNFTADQTWNAGFGITLGTQTCNDIKTTLASPSDDNLVTQGAVSTAMDLKANKAGDTITGDFIFTVAGGITLGGQNVDDIDTDLVADADDRLVTQKGIKTAVDLKVAKAGDTMSGDLTFDAAQGITLGGQNVDDIDLDLVADADDRLVTQKGIKTAVDLKADITSTHTDTYIDLNASTPVGGMMMFAGSGAAIPPGWILCDGTSYNTTTKKILFDAIQYTFGGGGSNFNVPDMRGLMPIGVNTDHDTASIRIANLGASGGTEDHTLDEAEMPAHTHDLLSFDNDGTTNDRFDSLGDSDGTQLTSVPGGAVSTGGGLAHENMPPFLGINYIIFAGVA